MSNNYDELVTAWILGWCADFQTNILAFQRTRTSQSFSPWTPSRVFPLDHRELHLRPGVASLQERNDESERIYWDYIVI